jgi:hypothetical protein
LLLLVSSSGVTINSVTVGGGNITFERPEALYLALWLVVLYFFVRYLQYIASESELWSTIFALFQSKRNGYLNDFLGEGEQTRIGVWKYESVILCGPSKVDANGNRKRLVALLMHSLEDKSDSWEAVQFYSTEISLTRVLWQGLRAALFVLVWRPVGTDFLLPLLLGFVAIGFSLEADWAGAIPNLYDAWIGPRLLSN